MSEEALEFDVVIVGAGPAGLACAIKLKQLSPEKNICIIEKGATVGSHILSGAVLESTALTELIPDWETQGAPVHTPVSAEKFLFLSKKNHINIPHWILPKELTNKGNHIISLSQLCVWLGEYAERLGVDIFPATAAKKILFDNNNCVIGIQTGELGLSKNNEPKSNHTPGFNIYAKHTLLAEGCRGFLTEQVIKHYQLRQNKSVQSYGLGVKELWEVDPSQHKPGLVQHTAGWPLDSNTYGGSFIYHMDNNKVAVGFVTALDYRNPYLNPFNEMQRFKLHPTISPLFKDARRLCFGARALNEGGLQALPKLAFPGGALLGCAAGMLNVAKIKGIHNAIRSGILAAQCLAHSEPGLTQYESLLRASSIYRELKQSRNFRQYFRLGLTSGTLLAGIDLKIFRGYTPWTLQNTKHDRKQLRMKNQANKIPYPKPNNTDTFSRLDSLYLANIHSDDDQPIHLKIKDESVPIHVNYRQYAAPETRYCPAKVYEYQKDQHSAPQLTINAANCIHCKACDIKDPTKTIHWTVPEGGSGPNYTEM